MNLPMFLNRMIIGFNPIKYTPFWWWYRLMSHKGFRFDDYHLWKEFWSSLSSGWDHMEYVHKFEEFWGKGSYPPERIVLPQKDFDALKDKLNEPPQYNESIAKLLNRKAPWDE